MWLERSYTENVKELSQCLCLILFYTLNQSLNKIMGKSPDQLIMKTVCYG